MSKSNSNSAKSESRRVLYARLQNTVYAPGAGDLGTTLPATNKTLEGLKMYTDGQVLTLNFIVKGEHVVFEIPSANVAIMQVGSEE